jgi:drug/metabolite transporter (DMT)-like permease
MRRLAVLYALASAALFGLSTPLAKILVGDLDPLLLAAVFYLGSGIGLGFYRALTGRTASALARGDLPWLAGAILSGGVVGPVLLMLGLARTDAATASLLLTSEGVATTLIAWFVFHENFDRRIAVGFGCIVLGAALLAWRGDATLDNVIGPLCVVGACVAWGIDNNLTRKISAADAIEIVMLKGICGGPVILALAIAAGAELPEATPAALAAIVGFLGYGVSIVCFIVALRDLGAARTGAYFSIAPFLGAVAAIMLFGEAVTWRFLLAGALMAFGVYLHLTERHAHEHEHDPMEHAHPHVHDTHHRHAHGPNDPPGEPHTHRHVHVRLRHSHAHMPDVHHIHRH